MGGLQRLAAKAGAAQTPPGVEDEPGVRDDVVVRQVRMVDTQDHEVGRRDLFDRAFDARRRRPEADVGRNVRVVRAHIGAEGEELFGDGHRR